MGECVYTGFYNGGDYCNYDKYTLALAFQAKKVILLTDSCTGQILHKETVLEDSQTRESFTECGASKAHCEESRTIYLKQMQN